jgi:hypothetical protein
MSLQPFQEDYEAYQHWVTHSLMKLVWEKAHHLRVEIDITDLPVHPPQERDSWLMKEFFPMNYNSDDLWRLNRVRIHWEVLILLDVIDASSWAINRKYLDPKPMDESWSSLSFLIEQPATQDFKLWKAAIPQIRALGGRLRLRDYKEQGHKIWAWQYDLETSTLYHCKGDLVDIYEPSGFPGACIRANRYSRTQLDQQVTPSGGPCTVEAAGLGIYKIILYTTRPPQIKHPETWRNWMNGAAHGCGRTCA